jgi:type IV secretion system protein VirB5
MASQQHDTRIGYSRFDHARRWWDWSINRSNRHWRLWQITALLLLVLLIIMTWYTLSHMNQPTLQPYVVRVTQSGDVEFEGKMRTSQVQVTDAIMRHYIRRFVQDTRQVPTDPQFLQQRLQDAYYIATSAAQNQLDQYVNKTKPFQMTSNDKRRDVKFRLFEQVSENTWRAEWTERVRQNGTLVSSIDMSGTFSYIRTSPANAQQAERNPLGIYFDSFNFAKVRQ